MVQLQSAADDELRVLQIQDTRRLEVLTTIAQKAGLSGPKDFLARAASMMSAEDAADFRALYETLKPFFHRETAQ